MNLINNKYFRSSEGMPILQNFYFQIFFNDISVCFLLRKNKDNSDNKNYPDVLTLFLLKSDSYLRKKFVLFA